MKHHPLSAAAAVALGMALAACGDDSDSQPLALTSVEFVGMAAPSTGAELAPVDVVIDSDRGG
jgi:hypothetical protein